VQDDDQTFLGFDVSTASAAEGDGSVTVTVRRNGATATAAAVNYTTTGGTATPGSDYVATNGTLNFIADEVSKNITVVILTDGLTDPSETFTIRLSGLTNSAFSPITNCTVTIADGAGGAGADEPDLLAAGPVDGRVAIEGVTMLPDGLVRIRVNGPAGSRVKLQATSDLEDWRSVTVGVIVHEFLDLHASQDPATPQQFFRVVAP
jgi:hypothetical protein